MALDYLNNLVPSHRKLAVVMVGMAPEHGSRVCLQIAICRWARYILPKASFVGGRIVSLGGLARLRSTFEVHNFFRVSVIEWYSDCPYHASMNLVATETITLVDS